MDNSLLNLLDDIKAEKFEDISSLYRKGVYTAGYSAWDDTVYSDTFIGEINYFEGGYNEVFRSSFDVKTHTSNFSPTETSDFYPTETSFFFGNFGSNNSSHNGSKCGTVFSSHFGGNFGSVKSTHHGSQGS